jgi:hypothetical protein
VNLVKLQYKKTIYKNLLHFYKLTINYQKEKLKQFHLQLHQKNKISRNKLNPTDKRPENYKMMKKEMEDNTNK